MTNKGRIIALHDNDVVFLAWQYDQAIPDCLGFSVRRRDLGDSSGKFVPLPAWVGWQGGSNANWKPQTTDVWPVQKFSWNDFTAKPGGTYRYEVVPMVGAPDKLKPLDELTLTSPDVPLTPDTDDDIAAYFNNGILSTQHLAHVLPPGKSGVPDYQNLLDQIRTPQNKLRLDLAGQMIDTLKSLLVEAQEKGGQCYCALYELDDPELIQTIIDSKGCIHLILSTAGKNDSTNQESRQRLHDEGIDITDRMLDSAHIGHNKFVVYTDQAGKPQAVLAGSTNWTSTGLCAQSNNSVIIRDPKIAGFYLDYWKRLKRDTQDADGIASELQSEDFRQENETPNVDGNSTVWFSPNTKAKSKPKGATLESGTPPDLSQVFGLIRGAQQAVLFLEFQPGSPSVLDAIKEAEQQNQSLFVRGAATDATAIQKFDENNPITTELYHRSTNGKPDIVNETGVAATAINDQFAYWKKELLKAGPGAHAIIHDKIIVIDPLEPNDCVVVTGSHNQGYKASYCNDENLLILRGNQPLALAYTTHVMDVYDHYRWRYMVEQQGDKAWTGLETTPSWQDKYFQTGNMSRQELDFWMSAPDTTHGGQQAQPVPIHHAGRPRRTGT
jgi:phosphatidylserine/phosphatidylglycerophosphate/cardiolipin synthase-like enzyme